MINILWDASHIWAYLVVNALQNFGLPFCLLRAESITQKTLTSKRVLIVPGGSARQKSNALGVQGKTAISDYVRAGGFYLGFCGGAGLALSTNEGLGLCAWRRNKLENRLQHLVSGHIFCDTVQSKYTQCGSAVSLPIWWASSFAEQEGDVQVLARYNSPDDDFYIGELKWSLFPEYILQDWRNIYGLDLRPKILEHKPCIIQGAYGAGQYLLSYSHLESPKSLGANEILVNILEKELAIELKKRSVPSLDICKLEKKWDNKILCEAWQSLERLISLGQSLDLLFERNSWLVSWKNGLSGSQLNNLRFALAFLINLEPSDSQIKKWKMYEAEFVQKSKLFYEAATNYFYARRLSDSLNSNSENLIPSSMLIEQRNNILGQAMENDGLCGDLVDILEDVYLN